MIAARLELRVLEADGSESVAHDPVQIFVVATNRGTGDLRMHVWRLPRTVAVIRAVKLTGCGLEIAVDIDDRDDDDDDSFRPLSLKACFIDERGHLQSELQLSEKDPDADAADRVSQAFAGKVARDCWLKPIPDLQYENPCVIRGDFDGNGKVDEAILVRETGATKRRGVALLMQDDRGVRAVLLGAGVRLGNGGDDFRWMDAWHIIRKTEARRMAKQAMGDGLVIEKSESGGGLVVFVAGAPRWIQWSD
jgi:hypothetical protein